MNFRILSVGSTPTKKDRLAYHRHRDPKINNPKPHQR